MNIDSVLFTNITDTLSDEALYTRLINVIQFANANLDAHYNDERFGYEVHPFIRFKDKVVVEAALLLLIASRVRQPSDRLQSLLDELRNKLAPMACGDRAKVLLKRHAGAALMVGFAPSILFKLGIHDEVCQTALHEAWQSGYLEAKERLPFRAMEIRWFRSLYYNTPIDCDDLISISILASHTHPVWMTTEDAYALTHALMYVTDFGSCLLPTSVNCSQLTDMIDSALAWCLMSENVDLMLELIMSAVMLNHSSAYVRLAWHFVSQVWDALGFLPAPRSENTTDGLTEEARQFNAFEYVYHPTFLGGMLCAMLLNAPPEIRETSYNQPTGALRPYIKAAIGKCGGLPAQPFAYWMQAIETVPLTTTELNTVMYDAALIHAAQTYRLDVLADLLRNAENSNRDTPTYRAAREFLAVNR